MCGERQGRLWRLSCTRSAHNFRSTPSPPSSPSLPLLPSQNTCNNSHFTNNFVPISKHQYLKRGKQKPGHNTITTCAVHMHNICTAHGTMGGPWEGGGGGGGGYTYTCTHMLTHACIVKAFGTRDCQNPSPPSCARRTTTTDQM